MKIVDKCESNNGSYIQPAPVINFISGITFDKVSPYDYHNNCNTLSGTLTSPADCRWHDCRLPSSISGSSAIWLH